MRHIIVDVIRYDAALGLSTDDAKTVSDHYPIEMTIKMDEVIPSPGTATVKGNICKCQVTVQCYLILFISRLLEPVTFYTIYSQLSYSRSTTFCSYAAAAAAAPARPTQPSCNP